MVRKYDYIQQLADYFKKNLSKGYTVEALKWSLINQGYSRTEVSRAIKIAHEQLAKKAPRLKEKPIIKYQVIDDKDKKIYELDSSKKSFFRKMKDLFYV